MSGRRERNGQDVTHEIRHRCAHRDLSPTQHLRWAGAPCSDPTELWVYNIDAWCSDTVQADGRCFQEVKLLMQRSGPHYHHHPVYTHPDVFVCITAHVFCTLCSMKEFLNFHFVLLLYNEGKNDLLACTLSNSTHTSLSHFRTLSIW